MYNISEFQMKELCSFTIDYFVQECAKSSKECATVKQEYKMYIRYSLKGW